MPDSASFTHRLVVRFRDCDLMGHVNNAVYFTYFEQCRLAWYESFGGLEAFPGVTTVVAHAECDYRAPAFSGDELEIAATLTHLGTSAFTASYAITNARTGQKIAEGKTTSVSVDPHTHRPVPLPQVTRDLFARTPA